MELEDECHAILVDRYQHCMEKYEVPAFGGKIHKKFIEQPYDWFGWRGRIDLAFCYSIEQTKFFSICEIKTEIFNINQTIGKFKQAIEYFPQFLKATNFVPQHWLILLNTKDNCRIVSSYHETFKNASTNFKIKLFDPLNCNKCKVISFLDKESLFLFSWNEIPRNDSQRLIIFLTKIFGIDWIKTAKIEKIDDDKAIKVTNMGNFLLLRLNNEKTKMRLEIDDGRMDEFIVKTENGELNIYVEIEISSNELGTNYSYENKKDFIEKITEQHFCPIHGLRRPYKDP